MKSKDEIDDAIYKTLFSYGVLRYNELFRKTRESEKCTTTAFDNNLKKLVIDKVVIKRKIGKQNVEYSINYDISEDLRNMIKQLDEGIKVHQKTEKIIGIFFKEFVDASLETKKEVAQKAKIFETCYNVVSSCLSISHLCSLLITSKALVKIQENKVRKFQNLCLKIVEKIMESIKNFNFKIYNYFLRFVFNKMTNPGLSA